MTLLPSSETNIHFVNRIEETAKRNFTTYQYMYNGGGVAIGDFNNDELPDIFFTGNDSENMIYLNSGAMKFTDVSEKANIESGKWSTGVTLVDINQDGYLDIYVCSSGPYDDEDKLRNQLYVNNGDLTFSERAGTYGIDDDSYSTQAEFFDMDNDGDLDLYVMNHGLMRDKTSIMDWEPEMERSRPVEYRRSCGTMYRNEGNGRFTDITKEAGLYQLAFGLGLGISDIDDNGFLDIYVANDYLVPDFMYLNNGNGTFTESVKYKLSHCSYYSMGCDIADINNDGLQDIAVVDMTPSDHYRNKVLMESMDVGHFAALVDKKKYIAQYMFNSLQLNRGHGTFSEIANLSGVSKSDWSWAVLLYDINNNGFKDMMVTNGYLRDTKNQDWAHGFLEGMKDIGNSPEDFYERLKKAPSNPVANYLYRNNGHLKFEDVSENWGFGDASFSNGAAYGDLDNDGDLDLVINNLQSQAYVYRNNSSETSDNNYIQFELKGGKANINVDHSSIWIHTTEGKQMLEYRFTRGFCSFMQPLAHFGIGKVQKIEKVEVFWNDGTVSSISDPAINTKHVLIRDQLPSYAENKNVYDPYFKDFTANSDGNFFRHEENYYDDFSKEILLPHKQSTQGPCLSVGDLNGDGLQDFYVGGAKGQAGNVYLQHPTAGLIPAPQQAFQADINCEDVGSLLFDADGDNDLDLYVASGGGGEFDAGSVDLQDRLYINEGVRGFRKSHNSLPVVRSSTKAIAANDWDNDGDLDLFVGGRTLPGKYPYAPASYLLVNEGGRFTDQTESLAPGLRYIGMVTDAEWVDMDGDNRDDLVITGEWMSISVFKNVQHGFEDATASFGFENTRGWWYSLQKGDFDNDGDMDLVAGNLGLNNKFQPTRDKPLHVFASDFDGNSTTDIVLSKHYKDDLAPVRGKECSSEQMPFIDEKFPMYSGFASATLSEIYGEENLNNALHYKVTGFASVYIENEGNGDFRISDLPIEAQLGPVNDIAVWDFNNDNNLDIVIGGNMINTEVETPAYDGNKGLFMFGNGDGTFDPVFSIEESGIYMPMNVKSVELFFITNQSRPAVIAANNNDKLHIFAWRK